MSTTTANLGLIKPELTDAADITQYNQNWDIIDEALENVDNIPITSEVPSDSDIWIDPNEETVEESHITDQNNPHNVTSEQVGAISMVKVWENPNISNAFNSQTISIDLSEYDGVEILYYVDSTTDIYQNTGFITKGLHGVMFYVTTDAGNRLHRTFTVNSDGIVFNSANANSNANVSSLCKPYRIYGIKGVM